MFLMINYWCDFFNYLAYSGARNRFNSGNDKLGSVQICVKSLSELIHNLLISLLGMEKHDI